MRKHFRQVFQVNMDKVWRGTIWRETSLGWRRLASKYWEENVRAGWGKECVENTRVLVCSGCYDKIPQSGWLNNRKFFFHRRRPEALGQGAGRFGFFGGLCWTCRWPPRPVSSCDLFSVHDQSEEDLWSLSFLIRAPSLRIRVLLYDLI